MQIKVTVASILLALSVVNAAPVQEGENMEARRIASFGKLAGKTSNDKLNTGLALGTTGMMAAGMMPQQRSEAENLESRATVGKVGSGLKSLAGKTPNDMLNTGLTAASTGMLASNTFGQQQKRDDLESRATVGKVGSGLKSLAGKTPNDMLNTGLSAASVGMLASNTFGQQQKRDDLESRATVGKVGSGLKSLAGKTPNDMLNTGLSAASTGMLASNTFGQQQKRGATGARPEVPAKPANLKGNPVEKPGSNNVFGSDPNSKLNTGLALGSTGMMAYNLMNQNQQQKRGATGARPEVPAKPANLKGNPVEKPGSNNVFGSDPNSKLNTGLAAGSAGMMAYNLMNQRDVGDDEIFIYQRDLYQ